MTKVYITSIGEPTTELCVWSLERQGFEVELLINPRSLWSKLKTIFENVDDDFLRVDADVVVNKNILELVKQRDLLWYQSLTFDWYKQDITHGGIQFIRKEAIPLIKSHIQQAQREERPETYLSRIPELHNPRTFGTFEKICGLNGYHQNDYKRVMKVKANRRQSANYDFELAKRLDEL
jgi:hypothetical protein